MEPESAIFISYPRGGEHEEVVNQIDQALQARGIKITRDKRDLGYKGSLKEFMERIGRGNCVIVVISDKYLRSPNCMFELMEIAEGKQFHDHIFPVVLNDANIYDPVKRIEYVRDRISGLASTLKDMNTLTPDMQQESDFNDLYIAIEERMKEGPATPTSPNPEESKPAESAEPVTNVSASNNSLGALRSAAVLAEISILGIATSLTTDKRV